MYFKDYLDNYRESPNEKFSDYYIDYAKSIVKKLQQKQPLDTGWENLCTLIKNAMTDPKQQTNLNNSLLKIKNHLNKFEFCYELEAKIYDPSISKMASGIFGRKTTDYQPVLAYLKNLQTLLIDITEINTKNNNNIVSIDTKTLNNSELFFAMLKTCLNQQFKGGRRKSRKSRKSRKFKKSRKSRK
jgi:hypothetical protein